MSKTMSSQQSPSPVLGDSLSKTITLTDEKRIGSNIYKNLQKNNYIIIILFKPILYTYIDNNNGAPYSGV